MFKSLTIYQLTQATEAVLRRLDGALAAKPFRPCGQHDEKSRGFVKPLGEESDIITYSASGATLFCLRSDEKVLPPAAVKLLVAEKVKARGGDLSKTDIRQIKEQITESLLPTTLATPLWTYAYIDRELSMLFVGATENAADHFIFALSCALSASPFRLLGVETEPCEAFTGWLREPTTLGPCFDLGTACSLKHVHEDGTAIINISHEDLQATDLHAMIDAGKECCRVALESDQLHFAITAKLGLRAISLGDALDGESEKGTGLALANEFATFVPIMRQTMRDLEPLLGGWPKQELLDLHDEQPEPAPA